MDNISITLHLNNNFYERENERMSFICQVCLHIRGICYIDRSSTVQQNDSDRTDTDNKITKYKQAIYKISETQYII